MRIMIPELSRSVWYPRCGPRTEQEVSTNSETGVGRVHTLATLSTIGWRAGRGPLCATWPKPKVIQEGRPCRYPIFIRYCRERGEQSAQNSLPTSTL